MTLLVVQEESCLVTEDLPHWRAKVSFPFIQGEKSTRRTSPVSDRLSCISVIPAFYVTAIFMFPFD